MDRLVNNAAKKDSGQRLSKSFDSKLVFYSFRSSSIGTETWKVCHVMKNLNKFIEKIVPFNYFS